MRISDVTMNGGKPGIQVEGVVLSEVTIDDMPHEAYEVAVFVEEGVEYPNPDASPGAFERWAQTHAEAAIRTKDDGIARRPNIWPDETQHADVYRAWHLDNVSISLWTTPAPKPPMVP